MKKLIAFLLAITILISSGLIIAHAKTYESVDDAIADANRFVSLKFGIEELCTSSMTALD